MLEELVAAGRSGAEYDASLTRIGEGNQFGSGFVGLNPNSKIPALLDYGRQTPQRVFESGAILLCPADKFGTFLAKDRGKRTEALNWLFWQIGSTPGASSTCSTGSFAGDENTIADMAIWPWDGNGMLNGASYNDARKFLQTHEYKNRRDGRKTSANARLSSAGEWT
jgi:GST-like protein